MSWVREMKKGLDRMWDGLVKDKLRQEGTLTDLAPKWYSVLIWIVVFLLICVTPLKGQRVVRPELVPYQIVPIDLQPGDCNLEVKSFEGLLTEFATSSGASLIIRGLRAVSDFEYEFQMTGMNTKLEPNIETVFLMASEGEQFISSRLVKEINSLGGDISHFVSENVRTKLIGKVSAGN